MLKVTYFVIRDKVSQTPIISGSTKGGLEIDEELMTHAKGWVAGKCLTFFAILQNGDVLDIEIVLGKTSFIKCPEWLETFKETDPANVS